MPKSKSQPKPETVAKQETGGACNPRLVRPYVEADYMRALSEEVARRKDLEGTLLVLQATENERMDEVARALGISTGRESWWESSREKQHEMILARAKRIRANVDVEAPNV